MSRRRAPGLYKKGKIWQIDKIILGRRYRETTMTRDLKEAERYLNKKIDEIRKARLYGERPVKYLSEAIKYYTTHKKKKDLQKDLGRLALLIKIIGDMPLNEITPITLQKYIIQRQAKGVKTRTINHGLKVIRHILNLAETEWYEESSGLTWIEKAPKIKLLVEHDLRVPRVLTKVEEEQLLVVLPDHLSTITRFMLMTGLRTNELCSLQWQWYTEQDDIPRFILPNTIVKNGISRVVVLNSIAREIILKLGMKLNGPVFVYKSMQLARINNTAWRKAVKRAGIKDLRVHDLRHTFGSRLRAAGVSHEDRQDLLGHKSHNITTHYSKAELSKLMEAVEKLNGKS